MTTKRKASPGRPTPERKHAYPVMMRPSVMDRIQSYAGEEGISRSAAVERLALLALDKLLAEDP